jgi:hypothetical protein
MQRSCLPIQRAVSANFSSFPQPKEASIIYRIIFLVKINPTKVVRAAIQNAASVASLLITTEAMIAEVPKKGGAAAPAMPGGGMGGMDF